MVSVASAERIKKQVAHAGKLAFNPTFQCGGDDNALHSDCWRETAYTGRPLPGCYVVSGQNMHVQLLLLLNDFRS